jgi:putative transposase
MPDYRRSRVPGGTYFFTANLWDRDSQLLTIAIDGLRAAVKKTRQRLPFHIDAWVVLPDHMHCVWTLPPGDEDYARRWQGIKIAFSKQIPKTEPRLAVRDDKGERAIWQRRYWEHTVRDERDYAAHVDYVHINPMKHGLVPKIADWPYSSFHRDVALGRYPIDWCGTNIEMETGERNDHQ